MKIVKTKFFISQVKKLSNKYLNINSDLDKFYEDISNTNFTDLWSWIYKYRIANSSIPTWKRWGFRLILKKYGDKFVPLLVYSKRSKDNVSDIEIIRSIEKVLSEL